ncbi:putative multi-domain containing protein [Aduncisulcus paluster]|uniref:Multi-domain containing protein n=1 Tax=Aduncisulcus paluster TaxID=2918883 RepID=A0ABQ5KCT1_9EUKA|nr:putative multi-domain containing protein [Aduncisulcus paluster]
MSAKRKHILQEHQGPYPELLDNQEIVVILENRGSCLFSVYDVEGNTFLARLPSRFVDLIYISINSFVIIERYSSVIDVGSSKVLADIIHILSQQQVKEMRKDGVFPKKWEDVLKQQDQDERKGLTVDEVLEGEPENPNRTDTKFEEESESDDYF